MNDEYGQPADDLDERKAEFLSAGTAYERGLVFGEATGRPMEINYTFDSMAARREFLRTGRLCLLIYGAPPPGLGMFVGDPTDLGEPASIEWPKSGAGESAPDDAAL